MASRNASPLGFPSPRIMKKACSGTVTGAGTAFGRYNAFSCFFHSYFINGSLKHVIPANRAKVPKR